MKVVVGLLLASSLAVAQASVRPPGESRPAILALPGYRVHLVVSENLAADSVRALARANTVLWLTTNSNMVRPSTLELLRHFPSAYVQLRAPLLEVHAAQLNRSAKTGVWLSDADLGGEGMHRIGSRPLAISMRGPLPPEKVARVRAGRAVRIEWDASGAEPSDWDRFAALPGERTAHHADQLLTMAPEDCPRETVMARTRLGFRHQDGLVHRCDFPVRLQIAPSISDETLAQLYRRSPSVELELRVDDSEPRAQATVELLRRLERATAGTLTGKHGMD